MPARGAARARGPEHGTTRDREPTVYRENTRGPRRRNGRVPVALASTIVTALAVAVGAGVVSGDAGIVTGSVAGTVRLAGAAERSPPPLGPYSRRRAVPPRSTESHSDPSDAVVVARAVSGPAAAGGVPGGASRTVRVPQRDRTIVPFVTVVATGTRIDFPNEDEVFHNLFSLSESNRFDLGRYPPGETRSHVFARTGIVRVFCDIHAEMSALIYVVDSPHHVRPAADGRYVMTGLPAGAYTVFAYHGGARSDSARVTVVTRDTARVDLQIRS